MSEQLKTVESEMKRLDPKRFHSIRDFYYDLAAALPQLAEELELADLDLGGEGGPLIEQHLILCQMMETFKKITIGSCV